MDPENEEPETATEAAKPAGASAEIRIGPYEVLRELGRGGMGVVYLAARADEQFRKRVAIKVIKTGPDEQGVIRRFRRERQILASLDHPNVARLLDGGATGDGRPYFVMEYIQGHPLHEYCDSHRLSIVDRLKVFQQVCSAVAYAHRNLIVHRDLKPSNILVTADGVPRLLDFGIAKLLNPELSAENPTVTGLALTPEYASPEQARGDVVTTASDVYSLGVLLYELLTGHRPYRLKTRQPMEVLKAVCEQEPERPSTIVGRAEDTTEGSGAVLITPEGVSRARDLTPDRLGRRLRGDLDNIVLMALRKEPQRRYASADALSEDLRRYLEGLPVKARKGTSAYRTGKYVKRHAVGVTAAAAFVVLLGSLAVTMTVQSARLSRERARAEANLMLAKKAVDESLSSVGAHNSREAPDSPEVEELRRELLDKARSFYVNLARQEPRNDAIATEVALAHSRLGDIDRLLEMHEDAVREYNAAISQFGRLAHDQPGKPEYRQSLAYSHNGLGETFRIWLEKKQKPTQYSAADAQREYDAALGLLGELHSGAPGNVVYQQELARSYYNRGILRHDSDSDDLAQGDFDHAVDLLRPLASDEPSLAGDSQSHPHPSQDLARVYNNLGNLRVKREQYEQAVEVFNQAIRILERLRRADPDNREYKNEIAQFYNNLALVFACRKEYGKASELNHKALDIFDEIARPSPSLTRGRADVLKLRAWLSEREANGPGASRSPEQHTTRTP